jgi:hypothetical protein
MPLPREEFDGRGIRWITAVFIFVATAGLFIIALSPWAVATISQADNTSLSANASRSVPTFSVSTRELSSPPVLISYGDMRFTNPTNTVDTNPKVRQWLVRRIAAEKPDVLLLGGDIPMHGGVANDYSVFESETAPWRAAHVLVFPTLGNHEFYREDGQQCRPDPQPCLANWWNTFPQLRGLRWYSVQIGDRIIVLNIDSDAPLVPETEQAKWIAAQLDNLPASVQFVFFNLHHPPLADPTEGGVVIARPNERALAALLVSAPQHNRVQFIVVAAHVHNYERFLRDGILYLVSGGGGAKPAVGVTRGPDDLYQGDSSAPNYHYIKWTLRESSIEAEMIRLSNPQADAPTWEVRDRFEIK